MGHFPTKEPDFAQSEIADNLIGLRKEKVLEKLGSPEQLFSEGAETYYLYSGGAKGLSWTLVFPLTPVPDLYPEDYTVCLLLAFDENDVVYKRYVYNAGVSASIGRCDELYSNDFEWISEHPASELVLQSEAGIGNAAAQYELYKLGKSREIIDLKLLCSAAEKGNSRAQWELGYIYRYGLHNISQDIVMSVMWYNHAQSAGYDPSAVDILREQLTSEQLIELDELNAKWKVGDCEKMIFGTKQNN